MRRTPLALAAVALAAPVVLPLASCGSDSASGTSSDAAAALPQGTETVELDPADFTTDITNPYWPMARGTKWVYRETDTEGTEQRVVVEVTDETKRIANGVEAVVVRDTVTEDGEPVEITDDWHAQDSAGNVWYLGEDTAEYENGKVVSRSGSFEAGVDGAQAGIIMPADPRPGMSYRQEYYAGEAEDRAEVVSVGEEQVEVPTGHYTDIVMTRDLVPLEPKIEELKLFARGVGPVLALGTSGGLGTEQLVQFSS